MTTMFNAWRGPFWIDCALFVNNCEASSVVGMDGPRPNKSVFIVSIVICYDGPDDDYENCTSREPPSHTTYIDPYTHLREYFRAVLNRDLA
jgi:hypothetical protein